MHQFFFFNEGRVTATDDTEAPVMVYFNPDADEKKHLIEHYLIDEHTLDSALDPQEVGRVEVEPAHLAVIFKRPKRYTASDNFLFKVTTSGYFLFEDKFIVVIGGEDPVFEGRCFMHLAMIQDLFFRMLFNNILHFTEHLRVMNAVCDELEVKVNKSMENKHLLHMFTIEKGLVYYLNAISSNGRVIEKLKANAARLQFTPENVEYLDDLLIENAQCSEQANTHSQVLSSLMDARASLVSNNLNVMMKNLNAIVIAVAIPSFFASMFGMSEFSMITGSWWFLAYPVFFLAMIGLGISTFFFIRKIEKYWR